MKDVSLNWDDVQIMDLVFAESIIRNNKSAETIRALWRRFSSDNKPCTGTLRIFFPDQRSVTLEKDESELLETLLEYAANAEEAYLGRSGSREPYINAPILVADAGVGRSGYPFFYGSNWLKYNIYALRMELFEEPVDKEFRWAKGVKETDSELPSPENITPPSTPIQKTEIFYPDPQVIQNLKASLTSQYGSCSLDDMFSGKHLENEHGGFYIVRGEYQQKEYSVADTEQAIDILKQHLCVIPGIGETFEKELRGRGYNSINDLLRHRIFSSHANDFLQILGSKDFNALHDWISSRPLPKSHPVRLLSSCFQDMSKLLFIDIETLSLYPTSPLILIGVAFFKPDGSLTVEQYLARDIADEKAILSHIVNAGKFKTILTFNGSTFDLPYMRTRCNYYGIEGLFDHPHFDLLYFGRRLWKGQFSSYSLKTLEREVLKTDRGDDLHPVYLIELYQEYLQTQKVGLLKPLIDHNRWDILSTVKLFTAMINKVVKDAGY